MRPDPILKILIAIVSALLIAASQLAEAAAQDVAPAAKAAAPAAAPPQQHRGSSSSDAPAPPPPPKAPPPPLRFGSDGTFKILQLTDLHLGERADLDAQTHRFILAAAAAEQPNLIVLSGDVVSGAFGRGARGFAEGVWRPLAAVLARAGVPYATVLGNHDAEADLGRRELVALEAALGAPLSLTRAAAPAEVGGATHYWLDVLASSNSSGGGGSGNNGSNSSTSSTRNDRVVVAARVWLLDSGRRTCQGRRGWGCVGRGAVEWAAARAAELPPAPGIAFVHIPPPQLLQAWRAAAAGAADAVAFGAKREATGCSAADSGLAAALRGAMNVTAAFSGHDHDNDFAVKHSGFVFGYG